jgi:hypothetical protein
MSYGFEPQQGVAGGDIRPHRFIKQSTAADYTMLEADANERTVGVAQENTQDAPVTGGSANAAEAGDQFSYAPVGTIASVEVGSGGTTHGALLKSDADGKAVLAATIGATMQWISGIALESASDGEISKIQVVSYPLYPALS